MNKSQSPLPKVSRKKVELKLSFSDAIKALSGGKKIRRTEWSDLQEYGLLKDNFLMIHRGDRFHTWIVSEGDLLSIDWVII